VKNIFKTAITVSGLHHGWLVPDGFTDASAFLFQHHENDSTSSRDLTDDYQTGKSWIGTLNGLNFYDEKNHSSGILTLLH
jgi:hypothetical protein